MTIIINKNNKENGFNNQFVFIFVNYNILLEAPECERKATGLAKCPQYVTKVIKVGFQNIWVGAHADYAIEEYRGVDIQLHSFFTAALSRRWSTSRPPPLGGYIHIYST
jgi:hypothetical protein